jgi:hypothetical protein
MPIFRPPGRTSPPATGTGVGPPKGCGQPNRAWLPESRAPANDAAKVFPAGFRRPPADPARQGVIAEYNPPDDDPAHRPTPPPRPAPPAARRQCQPKTVCVPFMAMTSAWWTRRSIMAAASSSASLTGGRAPLVFARPRASRSCCLPPGRRALWSRRIADNYAEFRWISKVVSCFPTAVAARSFSSAASARSRAAARPGRVVT